MKQTKDILVIGDFDVFNTGHLDVLTSLAALGEVTVAVVDDEGCLWRNGQATINPEQGRLEIVEAMRPVSHAQICPSFRVTSKMLEDYDLVITLDLSVSAEALRPTR